MVASTFSLAVINKKYTAAAVKNQHCSQCMISLQQLQCSKGNLFSEEWSLKRPPGVTSAALKQYGHARPAPPKTHIAACALLPAPLPSLTDEQWK